MARALGLLLSPYAAQIHTESSSCVRNTFCGAGHFIYFKSGGEPGVAAAA